MSAIDESNIISAAEDYVRHIYENKIPANSYKYHHWAHVIQVRDEVLVLAKQSGVSKDDMEMLILAALFHDTGFSKAYPGHEDYSISILKDFLASYQYPKERADSISNLIEVTKKDKKPKNILESIMKDADSSYLGTLNFENDNKNLRKELNEIQNTDISKKDWMKMTVKVMDAHEYYSDAAKQRYGKIKTDNRNLLIHESEPGNENPVEEDRKSRNEEIITMGNSKLLQAQFTNAIRNHVDLSSMADNKSHILISINVLIITVAYTLILKDIPENKLLLIPTIILLAACVISMIYSALATRPKNMNGFSSMESILNKSASLFFFGNFYKMTLDEYKNGMKVTIQDEDILNAQIIRDLYFLGKTLGYKYGYLRKSYSVLMIGIIFSVVSFIIVFSF